MHNSTFVICAEYNDYSNTVRTFRENLRIYYNPEVSYCYHYVCKTGALLKIKKDKLKIG